MAIIYSYPESANILGTDLVVGTTTKLVDNKPRNQTKNFSMINISNYVIGNIPRGTLTTSNDQNITLTLGGFPEDSLFKDVSISVGWSGLLQDDRIASSGYWNSKQDALVGNGLVKSVNGTISYITDSSINWNNAYDAKINSASVTGGATKTLTLNKQDGSTITASWEDESGLEGVGFVKANGTAISYDNSTYVPTTRTITINGVSQDLSSNRSWTVNSAAVWGSITGTLSSQTDLQNALNNKQDNITGTGIVYSSNGLISYITNNSSDWNAAYSDKINSASVTGTTTKTLTLNQQDGGTITASWNDDGGNISLTTNGTSGPATLSNNILNIPNYTTAGGATTWGDITGTLSDQTDLQNALSLLAPYSGATADVNLGNYTISSGKSLVGSEANFTRFPNALSVVSNIPSMWQHNESLYIGLIAEALSVGTNWASGIYGAGYTNATGVGRGTGVTGEGHVGAATDTGVAVGVRGYANDVHTGNYNIGLYGDAANGDPGLTYGGNVALFLANGNIVTSASANKNWFLGGNLTFNGQGATKTIGVTNGAKFDFGGTGSQLVAADGTLISAGTNVTISGGTISATGGGGGSVAWGGISGTLSNQTDLQNALNAKANTSDVVTLTTPQTISGDKIFSGSVLISGIGASILNFKANGSNVGSIAAGAAYTNITSESTDGFLFVGNGGSTLLALRQNGNGIFTGSVTASSIIKLGGTSSQFLKANGDLDSTSYTPTARTITINGTALDLSANRSWSVGTVTSVSGTGSVSGLTLSGTVTGSGSLTLGGTLSLTSGQVTSALGYTPYSNSNPSGFITGISSGMVTSALGYTPYNSSNPSGYITGISSGMVTTALGYTPYNSSNPNGYITSSALSGYLPLTGGTVSGSITASGGFYNSDIRLKDIISRDGDVAIFKWKDGRDDKTHIGYIAQEVKEIFPDAINEGEDGMLSVNYIEVLVAKIAELEKRIKQLEK